MATVSRSELACNKKEKGVGKERKDKNCRSLSIRRAAAAAATGI
jgi:hypothetical protein